MVVDYGEPASEAKAGIRLHRLQAGAKEVTQVAAQQAASCG